MNTSLPSECEALLDSLKQATARLAGLDPTDSGAIAHALSLRSRTLDGMMVWLGGWVPPSQLAVQELAVRLHQSLEGGAQTLLRLTLAREANRVSLAGLNRELQILRSLGNTPFPKSVEVDCQG